MSLVNIISAVGNNSSVYPLIVRDCGIEVPTKIAMTYNQNLKDSKQMANNALRERLIDEYGTSIVWLGGIPLMNAVADWGIKKLGYDPKVNVSLLKENERQGLKYNIEKFKNLAPDEVKAMEKVLKNKSTYQKLLAGKFVLSTAIPIAIMGYYLPKFNFALTDKLRKKQEAVKPIVQDTLIAEKRYEMGENPSFKGLSSTLANMSTVNKMAITDGGLTIGRVGTARNKYEKMENGFKMSMMMFLNFIAPIWIAKGLDNLSGKLFNTNVNLDPMLLADKQFVKEIKDGSLQIPESNYIEYLDKNPDSKISKLCEKYCGVKYLKNRVRDPREFVDEKKIGKFLDELRKFSKEAAASGNVDKYAKKALKVKSANILANVGISSFLLAAVLPKVTFILRKKVTGSDAEPGLMA
ncbi:TPA: hypothetical protein CPT87_09270 [Candidatus Gastranaerophilales bacterium HUM_5]|jgi:hypothetical protein|nr:hypothetical protein [bacterium]MBS5804464.1 hypothetical protein [Acinetobacter sp.]DAA87595.1 MAG TPA: hypothetical protein CPT99_04345 [Candidatus Gastranaerophilales bacterium HUM_4]DAA89260.1 MAG TPA: hypothetical protein CPT87_09270 [Candidatus Gastranaerophilales bacterium HUM_5]DAA96970.1 MAG TPA: hypothetical protein CPT88_03785 [Candidatus Gastranaerophilales bacterium HUM_8]DAB19001.1 MAG TPA: hypothetical protein CPT97_02895 [Candidatus Gastranaerophilales bacterium HUM_17]DAB1